jgi:hypothetical protein
MPRVLVLGSARDPQVRRVRAEVRARDGTTSLLDTFAFPERSAATLEGDEVRIRRKPIPVNVQSVYLRGLGAHALAPQHAVDLARRPRGLLAQIEERLGFVSSVVEILRARGVPIINSLDANLQHRRKPYQLNLLRAAGLPVPGFVATNDPRAVKTFLKTVKRAVYKPVAGGATVREVTARDMGRNRLKSLALAPVLFQELVEGVSVRAYVVGNRVVAAAELHSTELDYRRAEDDVISTRLTPAERDAAVAATQACGMAFAGVDLVRGMSGFYVLECNPSPMFAVFEHKTGLDVAGPLARLLLRPAAHGISR